MVRETTPIDVSSMPDVSRLAREVASTGTTRVLSENGHVLARLTPARSRRRTGKVTTREEMLKVFAETHGAWAGLLDPEEFKRERERLQVDERASRAL
jgi:antitoxin (DNA-binding transcriptional repressor) of toxin-antitoxin stability system